MRILFTLIFLLITCLSATAQLTNGLVAHWDFNGNANDVSGNGYNGTPNNISYTAGINGIPNTAALFNGVSSNINVAYQSGLNVSTFSICAFVKVNGFYTGNCQGNSILSRGVDHSNGFYTLIYSDNPYDLSCSAMDTAKNVFYSILGTTITSIPYQNWRYNPQIKTGNWQCVITTYDGTTSKIYLNGTLVSTVSPVGSVGSSTQGLRIGASGNTTNFSSFPYWMNGAIDDLRLYNRALTPSEVSSFCSLFDTAIVVKDSIAKKSICLDDTLHLSYVVTNTFKTGNIFTAQLSDANGNFSLPVNIGTLSSITDGKIVCHIPTGLTPGNGYRLRIISTNPVRISDITSPFGIYSTLIPSVTISATPSGPYAPNQYITFVSTPVDAGITPTFQWYRNGNPIPGANDDSLYINTLNDGDSLYIVVTSSNPCPPDLTAQSNKIGVNINSSVNDIQLPNLSLYPNPNNGSFTVSANAILYNEVLLEVINPLGQVITGKRILVTDKALNERIETGQISSGIYLLRISADGKQRNIRFTVNN